MGKECGYCFGTGNTVSGGEIFPYACPECDGEGWITFDYEFDADCQDAVEGRARFARPNILRPSKAIGE